MYVRVKSNPRSPRKSVQIVESKRIDGKVKQRVIQHIGVAADEAELEELKLFANSIKAKLELDGALPLYDPKDLDVTVPAKKSTQPQENDMNRDEYTVNLLDLIEEDRIIKGIHNIYGKLYDDMNFKSVLPNPARNVAISKALKEIVLARVANPDSKRASVDMLASKFGVNLDLKTVYRMMDAIGDDRIIKLNKLVLNHTKDLLNNTIDIVYFDATTLYFESFSEDEGDDAIKKNGYSKDGKFNQPQVVLALLVTKQGLPIGYKAFSGDTFDGHTLIPAIEEIKDELEGLKLDKVVYVADSGMFNKVNLEALDQYELDYIVGARIKNLSNDLKEKILDITSYEEFDDDKKIKTLDYNGKKLIVTYSQKRARKDKSDRLKAIEKLKKRLQSSKSVKSQLSNQGYKKYLQLQSPSSDNITNKDCDFSIVLNEDKIKEDEAWDGLKGIITNNTTLSKEELIHQYSNLWQVEESFRITKHDLKIRPIYHWKPSRIKAHLAISFIAYTLVRHLEYKIKLLYKKLSPEKIRQLLLSVQSSIFYDTKTNNKYSMPSHLNYDQKKIYKLMGAIPQLRAQKL
jgi:transposase